MPSFAVKFRSSVKDRPLIVLFVLSLLALGLDIGLLLWKLPTLGASQRAIALHYSVFFGVDWVGAWWLALAMPALGLGVLILNTAVAVILHPTERFVSRAFLAVAFGVNSLLAVGALFTVLANL